MKAGASIVIDGGSINIDSSDDAIHSNDLVMINGGVISVSSGDDGIHADSLLEINGGEILCINATRAGEHCNRDQ